MTLVFHSFLCYCLMATVAHCVELQIQPKLKESLSIWLGSRMKRDLQGGSLVRIEESEHVVRSEDTRDTPLPGSGTDIHSGVKRSEPSANQSRRHGCSLGTCTVHDLTHDLHRLRKSKLKIATYPVNKISP